ncbi:hypothetical protein ACEWY4_016137 [Coilia grayii]|uniref:Uncharacterized protein n=1 Tax=Coilia grayii TaxID=363190 RepID=A0ABD1JQZ9_9TELE
MVSGHSFLPCDRSFATLEKMRKVTTLYTPSDVVDMTLGARQQQPFNVLEMKCQDFRQLPDTTLRRPPGFLITSMMWMKLQIRGVSIPKGAEGWKTWLVTKPRKNGPPPVPSFATSYGLAYEDPLSIKKEKHRDLMTMLMYMPAEAQAFYEALECEE